MSCSLYVWLVLVSVVVSGDGAARPAPSVTPCAGGAPADVLEGAPGGPAGAHVSQLSEPAGLAERHRDRLAGAARHVRLVLRAEPAQHTGVVSSTARHSEAASADIFTSRLGS